MIYYDVIKISTIKGVDVESNPHKISQTQQFFLVLEHF